MTIERTPQNLARDIGRQMLPKVQKRLREPKATKKPRMKEGFPSAAREAIDARSGGACELDKCGTAEVYHHRRPRGLGGTSRAWVNRPANALHVSDACHLRIEVNRTQAYMNGWLVAMNGSAISADVPVLYRRQWVLLRDDGSVKPLDGDCWDESEVLS